MNYLNLFDPFYSARVPKTIQDKIYSIESRLVDVFPEGNRILPFNFPDSRRTAGFLTGVLTVAGFLYIFGGLILPAVNQGFSNPGFNPGVVIALIMPLFAIILFVGSISTFLSRHDML